MIEPVYPLTEGLSANAVRKALDAALAKMPALPEWQDGAWRERNGFPFVRRASHAAPAGAQPDDIAPRLAGLAPPRL
ncbi:MAG: hypothetical protein M5U33_03875 [Pseudorhodoplanes sp.]|nr:hypothetical protein [Pseudorhodoplanes sp.]